MKRVLVLLAAVNVADAFSYGSWIRPLVRMRPSASSSDIVEVEEKVFTPINDSLDNIPESSRRNEILVDSFISAWRMALGGNMESLQKVIQPTSTWDNPFVAKANEQFDFLKQFSGFFLEPALSVFDVKYMGDSNVELKYQLSFWYPTFWRPRIIIPGKASLTLDLEGMRVDQVKERWLVSILSLFLEQFPPRLWDIWHIFSSPAPEYPPIRILARVNGVSFAILPQSAFVEVSWSGLAKYQGPPLSVIPGFALFGQLLTSRMNREPFFTVLPVEVQSAPYTCAFTGDAMKETSWLFHVPTHLQQKVWSNITSKTSVSLDTSATGSTAEDEDEDDDVLKTDFVIGVEKADVMRSVSGGTLRGFDLTNEEAIARDEMMARQCQQYSYRILPGRVVAFTDVKGEDVGAEQISAALKKLKIAVDKDGRRIFGRDVRLKVPSDASGRKVYAPDAPALGLELQNIKVCFNERAEPSMAIYEQHFGLKTTRVRVELDLDYADITAA